METPSISSRLIEIRKWLGSMKQFAWGVLGALLVLLIYHFSFSSKQLTEREVNDAIAFAMASATPRPSDGVEVYRIIQPSIVYIEVKRTDEDGKAGRGLGTGVIIDEYADILTSFHVIENSNDIEITFADGSKSKAFVLNEQPEQDIALLRAFNTPQEIMPATLGNPSAMHVGDEVFVVGNPFGLYSSMSAGVISGFNRSFHPEGKDVLTGLIQFDAAANPGNSGGPLLDRNGFVIGVVTGLVSPVDVEYFVGVGFAVPITTTMPGGGGSPPY